MTNSVDDTVITNAGANAVLEIPQEALLRNDVPVDGTTIVGLGGATRVDGQIRYTTAPDFPGTSGSFVYQASDGVEVGEPATVTVTGGAGSTITGTDDGEILVADPTVPNPPATVADINADPGYGATFSQFGERATGSTIYAAQTFTAPAGGAAAQGLRFALGANDGPSDIEFRVLIVTNDATGVDQFGTPRFSPGQVLFSSVTLTKPGGSGEVVFDVSLGGLSLTPGQTYAFILDPIGVTTSEGLGLTTVRSSSSGYTGGGAYVLSTPTNATAANQPSQFAGDFTPIS